MVNLEIINNLWFQIDKLHLIYLQTEDSPLRIEQKKKLEACMKDYLSLVAPNQRFYYPSTKDVLYNSIIQKKNREQFSLTKFSHAWEMLGMYAANLLSQPWRKEFREIRLYSGAFKHQIEQQLIGAEDILMTMGYTLDIEYNRLVMQSVLDPDRVVVVSRDCLLAKVEAQILSEIHAGLSLRLGSCSWTDIFNFRDRYVGSVSHCIRGLLYHHHQKEAVLYSMNQPMPAGYLGPHEVYPMNNFPFPMGIMGNMGGMGTMGHTGSMGPMSNMGNMSNISNMTNVANMGNMSNIGGMTSSMGGMCSIGGIGGMGGVSNMSSINSMGYPYNKQGYNYPYPLPLEHYTGYLPKTLPSDEVDLPRSHTTEMSYPKSIEKHSEEPIRIWNSTHNHNPIAFSNYNHLGGNGNVCVPSGSTNMKSVPKFDSNIDIDHLEQLCNEESENPRRKIEKASEANGKKFKDDRHISEKSMYVVAHSKTSPNSAVSTIKEELKTPVTDRTVKSPMAAPKSDISSTGSHKTRKSSSDEVNTVHSVVSVAPAVPSRQNVFNGARPKERPSTPAAATLPSSSKETGWECLSCTYVNPEDRDICEICAKSRHKGPETQPLLRGGRECSKCTLVNPPDAVYCGACASSLDDAPTYI